LRLASLASKGQKNQGYYTALKKRRPMATMVMRYTSAYFEEPVQVDRLDISGLIP
jgi:hypothetical protein